MKVKKIIIIIVIIIKFNDMPNSCSLSTPSHKVKSHKCNRHGNITSDVSKD